MMTVSETPTSILHLPNPQATRSLGECLATTIGHGDVILLDGELGAGKTTFTQGLARGLGIADDVLSPTFALMSEYRGGRIPLLHVDAYRLSRTEDAHQLGIEEYLDNGWALVVEWAGNIPGAFPSDSLEILFEYEGDARRATLRAHGAASRRLLEEANVARTGN